MCLHGLTAPSHGRSGETFLNRDIRGCARLCRRWYTAGACETGGRIISLRLNKNGFREIILYFFEALLPPQLQMSERTAIPAVAPRIRSGRGAGCPSQPGTVRPARDRTTAGARASLGGDRRAGSGYTGHVSPAACGRNWGRFSVSLQSCCGCNSKTQAGGLAPSFIFKSILFFFLLTRDHKLFLCTGQKLSRSDPEFNPRLCFGLVSF